MRLDLVCDDFHKSSFGSTEPDDMTSWRGERSRFEPEHLLDSLMLQERNLGDEAQRAGQ